MDSIFKKPLTYRFLFIIGIILIMCFSMIENAHPESSWWQIGKDLLRDYGESKKQNDLTIGEITAGLKDALRVGTDNVVSRLGKFDGFNADSAVHIPLPDKLKTVKTVLQKVGMSHLIDDLEVKLNRAAENATPKAKRLFQQAITDMTLNDVKAIYKGPDDAATRYFQKKMSPALREEMRPVIEDSLAEVGAIQAYDAAMGQYLSLPFVPDMKTDLTYYVIDKGMDGVFYYLAREEAAIRQDPVKRTTDLLKRVFGTE